MSTLRSIGYTTLELLLTPLQFEVPNSRLRYYLLAKREPLQFQDVATVPGDDVWRHIPGQGPAWSDPRFENKSSPAVAHTIFDYLDDLGEGYAEYAIPDKILEKWGRLFDIVKPSSDRTCCFTRGRYLDITLFYFIIIDAITLGYTQLVERAGSILQENEDLDVRYDTLTFPSANSLPCQTTAVFDKFLQSQAQGNADAVKILHSLRLRYFTPSELLRLFAFDPLRREPADLNFVWPDSTSKKSKYKLIGNSINVKVVQALIEYLFTEPE